jgi:hypothetical protein
MLCTAPLLKKAGDFSEGVAAVIKDDLIGYIDEKGNWVLRPQFQRIENST